jgi:hypothetical protein
MKVTTRRIERLTIELEPGDNHYYIPNPFSRSFYMEPTQVVAEFTSDAPDVWQAIRSATVTGQRYRHMADGTIKKVGPGRGPRVDEPATWNFPSRTSMPHDLAQLLYDAYLAR